MRIFHVPDALAQRLVGGERPVVFLVGSALTMPSTPGKPGVCNVRDMLGQIRERVARPRGREVDDRTSAQRALRRLDAALNGASDDGARYQLAFEHLKACQDGAESVNAVIREAVLRARKNPTPVDVADVRALEQLESSPEGWHLGPAVKALGLLIARHPERFGRIVLTTNFDPLVEIAIRAAGGKAKSVDHLGDGALALDSVVTSVVHLHGFWRADTLHTPGALTLERESLRRSLARLYEQSTLVVLGYGGWDDVLTTALTDLTADVQARPDILWCFYSGKPEAIAKQNPRVLGMLDRLRERAVCYAGVDCNDVLPALRRRLDGEGELLGRGSVCSQLLDSHDRQRAVEILGEPYMERSALLAWLERQMNPGTVACFSARRLALPTPVDLVLTVATALNRRPAVEACLRRQRAVPNADDATRALDLLHDAWILIDDAEALAHPEHGFSLDFLAALRAKVAAQKIHWIAVSKTPLGELFGALGLSSPFFNLAERVYAGGLDRQVTRSALEARLGARAAEALVQAGTLPRLVYRLCDAEWEDVDVALRALPAWAAELCARWWDRPSAEQALLRRAVDGSPWNTSSEHERSLAAELCNRGLLVEAGPGYALNGAVWEAYVRARR